MPSVQLFSLQNFGLPLAISLCACVADTQARASAKRSHTVTATAYNLTVAQTDGSPRVGAWGDRLDKLEPGVRAIAVSQDLVEKGLERNQRVRIDKLDGEFVVLDRMPSQWTSRIDIHMDSVDEAREWGEQRVEVSWRETD